MQQRRQRVLISSLAVGLLLWWFLPSAARQLTGQLGHELQAPIFFTHAQLKSLRDSLSQQAQSKRQLIKNQKELSAALAAHELALQEIQQLRTEHKRLEALLHLPPKPEYKTTIARVAQRDLSAWWQRLIIAKGKLQGVQKGDVALYAGGIVGRVREAHLYTASVELISSPHFRTIAQLEGHPEPLTFRGAHGPIGKAPRAELLYIPSHLRLKPGQSIRVITSELGGAFPPGLALGKLIRLEPSGDGYFQRGIVELDKRLASLTEILMVRERSAQNAPRDEHSRPQPLYYR